MTKRGSFLGSWVVSQYVYDPDGTFVGIMSQRRELERLTNGRILIRQHCRPAPELANHPLGELLGTPAFELSVDGHFRRYHGPAVIGTGRAWGPGAMTGRGLWPQFGHNFISFSVLAHHDRQLSGGKFFNATQMIANLVGISEHETVLEKQPLLSGPKWPGEIATTWEGTLHSVASSGRVGHETRLQRYYGMGTTWKDIPEGQGYGLNCKLQPRGRRLRVTGSHAGMALQGVGKQFGWLLEIEAVLEPDRILESMEILDGRAGYLVGLRRWLKDNELERIEVIRLRPKS